MALIYGFVVVSFSCGCFVAYRFQISRAIWMKTEPFKSEANGLSRFSIYCTAQHFERGLGVSGSLVWSVASCDSIN